MSSILGLRVEASSYKTVTDRALTWARARDSRTLLFATVHMVMEAFDHPGFQAAVNGADIVNPDGMPLVWALRALGERHASRVYGPDASVAMLAAAEEAAIPVGFYGGTPETLSKLISNTELKHPRLEIAFQMSPPFRALSAEEDRAIEEQINASGARILFIGLGCPRQELWANAHRGRIKAVMFVVGAAFDFLAGTKPQAPRWMMRSGLEWLYRLVCEPRRLWARYLKQNPRFVVFFLQQWIAGRFA